MQAVFRRQFAEEGGLLEIGLSSGKTRETRFEELCRKGTVDCSGFTGHIPYGAHRYISGETAYMTMFRDPVSRYVSQYHDVLLKGTVCLSSHLRLNGVKKAELHRQIRGGLTDFLDSPLGIAFGNMQTRYLAGINGNVEVTSAVLQSARQHLDEVRVVGLTEKFDESLVLMAQVFGWNDIAYERLNSCSERARLSLSEEQRQKIIKLNVFDMDLYRQAQERFKQQVEEYSGDFAEAVQRLKEQNQTYRDPDCQKPLRDLFARIFLMFHR